MSLILDRKSDVAAIPKKKESNIWDYSVPVMLSRHIQAPQNFTPIHPIQKKCLPCLMGSAWLRETEVSNSNSGVLEECNSFQLHIHRHPHMCDKANEHLFYAFELKWTTSKIMQVIPNIILSRFLKNITWI